MADKTLGTKLLQLMPYDEIEIWNKDQGLNL